MNGGRWVALILIAIALVGGARLVQLRLERQGLGAQLLQAVEAGDRESAQRLIQRGASTNVLDAQGRSPLFIAAGRGDLEMVRLLVDNGAFPDGAGPDQQTPLMAAVSAPEQKNAKEIASLLLGRGASPKAVDAARVSVEEHARRGGASAELLAEIEKWRGVWDRREKIRVD
ncbi:MAG: ankyrin repeat domain-containing protein [Armatimonadota bacterium]